MLRSCPIPVVLASALLVTPAQADFVIKTVPATVPSPASLVGPGTVADEPHIGLEDRQLPAVQPGVLMRPRLVRPPLVAGFGNQVPLAFACRQIVPASVRVSYGPGADPDRLVSWKGGDPWPLVLGRAIKPLGLHMVASRAKLEIRN